MSSSSTIAPLVSVSGYTGKVLRIGRAFNPFKRKKKKKTKTMMGRTEEEEEEDDDDDDDDDDDQGMATDSEDDDLFLNAAEADRKRDDAETTRKGGGGNDRDDDQEEEEEEDQDKGGAQSAQGRRREKESSSKKEKKKNETNTEEQEEEEEEEEDEEDEEEEQESEDETNEVDVGRDWATMQRVLDRQPQADAMVELWRRDKGKWLIESKKRWKKRHDELTARRKKENPNYTSGVVAGDRARRADELSFVNRASRAMNAMQRGQMNADAHMAAFGRPVKVAVNLATLTKLGFLNKGKKKLFVVYLGTVYPGDLTEEGEIICGCKVGSCDRRVYTSPSAWAIHCKRNANPSKKADDGWKSARYGNPEGYALEHFKGVYDAWRRGIEIGAPAAEKNDDDDDDDDDADMVNDAAKEPDSLEKRQRDATKAEKACVYPLPEGTYYEPDEEEESDEEEEKKEEDDGDDKMDVDN